jgi:TIR domain
MQLLNQVIIKRPHAQDALIQLLQGDLTALPKEHAADILIVSAYPGSYIPVPNTLIANLYNKGIDVAALAKHKAIDLRDQLGCWLSETLSEAQQAQFNFKKILCFEPWLQTNEQVSVVGNIFRCINTFAFNENNNVIAMPVLSSGKQKVPFEKMLPAMMDASIFWLESGLPVICMKLVLFSDEQSKVALPIFTRAVQQYQLKKSVRDGSISGIDALKKFDEQKQQQLPGEESLQIVGSEIKEMAQKEQDENKLIANPVAPAKPPSVEPPVPSRSAAPYPAAAATISENKAVNDAKINSPAPGAITADAQYDYFISYAHKHAAIVDLFVNNLTTANKNLQVFYDKSSIPPGGLWIKQISDAIQKAKKVLIFLSPEYSNSPVCWDEFQCAKLMEYNSKKQLIQSIYLYNDAALPPIMGIYSWADCREGDKDKLQQMAEQLVSELSGQ